MRIDRTRAALAAVVAAALALRLAGLWQLCQTPYYDHLVVDALSYHDWALRILQGDWLGRQEGVFYQSPGYPYFLALVYKIAGVGYFWPRLIQAAAGGVLVGLMWLLARRLFGPLAGWLAAGMTAVYGPFVYEDLMYEKTSLTLPLVAGCLLALIRGRMFLGGALLGLGILLRGNLLFFVPAAAGWVWFATAGRPEGRPLRTTGRYLLGVALVILPFTIRNYVIGHDLVLVNSTFGINVFVGFNPAANGMHASFPIVRTVPQFEEQDAKRHAESVEGRSLKPSEVSSFWVREALTFIRQYPRSAWGLVQRKFTMFWNWFEVPDSYNFSFLKRYIPATRWAALDFHVIGPLALVGMGITLIRRSTAGRPEGRPLRTTTPGSSYAVLLLYVASYLLSVLATYVTGRYRAPAVPVLILYAAAAVAAAVDWIRARAVRPLIIMTAGLVLAGMFCLQKVYGDASFFAVEYDKLGVFYLAGGEDEKAVEAFRSAIAVTPLNWSSRMNLAMALDRVRRFDEAEPILLRLRADNPADVQVAAELGIVRLHQKRLPEAIALLREAVRGDPAYGKAWRFLTEAYREAGDVRALLAACEAWTRALPQDAEARARLSTVRAYLHP